jgi:hypothetical protein
VGANRIDRPIEPPFLVPVPLSLSILVSDLLSSEALKQRNHLFESNPPDPFRHIDERTSDRLWRDRVRLDQEDMADE